MSFKQSQCDSDELKLGSKNAGLWTYDFLNPWFIEAGSILFSSNNIWRIPYEMKNRVWPSFGSHYFLCD
jgi:hypothetical protein